MQLFVSQQLKLLRSSCMKKVLQYRKCFEQLISQRRREKIQPPFFLSVAFEGVFYWLMKQIVARHYDVTLCNARKVELDSTSCKTNVARLGDYTMQFLLQLVSQQNCKL